MSLPAAMPLGASLRVTQSRKCLAYNNSLMDCGGPFSVVVNQVQWVIVNIEVQIEVIFRPNRISL